RSRQGNELAQNLRERLGQLETIAARTERFIGSRRIVTSAMPSLRIPRRGLRARVANLKTLEREIASDIKRLTARDALDARAFDAALKEAEDAVLDAWRKFAKAPLRAAVDAVENDPDADRLRLLRQQLDGHARQLPVNDREIADVVCLKRE